MKSLSRSFAVLLFATAAATLLLQKAGEPRTIWRSSGGQTEFRIDEIQSRFFPEAEREAESGLSPGVQFFYMQRLYGNPSVNVDEQIARAWREVKLSGVQLKSCTADPVWNEMGPTNIAGRVRAIAFHPSDPSIVYAGGASGGVFKSTNGGMSWRAVTDAAPSLAIGAIAVDPLRPDYVYAGTGEPTVQLSRAVAAPSVTGIGVLRSTDAGDSWDLLPWPRSTSAVSRIQIHPLQSDTVLVGTRDGLMKSPDRGESWNTVLSGVVSDVKYKEAHPSVVFAAIGNDFGEKGNGVYRSDAGGKSYSWKRLGNNFPAGDSTGRIILATTPADPQMLLAFLAQPLAGNNFFALMRSSDDGESWERVPTSLLPDFPLGQAFYNFCAAISPSDPRIVFAGGLEIHRSPDRGNSFGPITFAGLVVHVDQHVLAFQPGSGILYVGNDGGVVRTLTGGSSWQRLDSALGTVQFYTVTIDRLNRVFGGTQDNGTLRLVQEPDHWTYARADVDGGAIQADSTMLYSMSAVSRFPFRSTNNGASWFPLQDGFGADDRPNWLQPLLLHPHDRTRLFTATQYVYVARNVNNPSNVPVWTPISPDLTTNSRPNESVISTLAIPTTNANWMYIGTGDGKVQRTENLGFPNPTWIDVSAGLPNRWITDIAVDPLDARTVYVSMSGFGSGHIFKSTDAGASWLNISGNLPDIPVNAILVSLSQRTVLFAATDLGVWQTSDGVSWRPFGKGLPSVVVYDLAIGLGGRIFAATHGRGMWSADAAVEVENAAPLHPSAISVFPAPMKSGTVAQVSLSIEKSDMITLSITDITGRLLFKRNMGFIRTGIQTFSLEAGSLHPGIYLLSISGARVNKSTKLVVFN